MSQKFVDFSPTAVLSWLLTPAAERLTLVSAPHQRAPVCDISSETMRLGRHPLTLFLEEHLEQGSVQIVPRPRSAEAWITFPDPTGAGRVTITLPNWTTTLLDLQMQITTPRQWAYFLRVATDICKAAALTEGDLADPAPPGNSKVADDSIAEEIGAPSAADPLRFRFELSPQDFSNWVHRELFSMFTIPDDEWIGSETSTTRLLTRYLASTESPPLPPAFRYRLLPRSHGTHGSVSFSAVLAHRYATDLVFAEDDADDTAGAPDEIRDEIRDEEMQLLIFALPDWVRRVVYLGPFTSHDQWRAFLTQLSAVDPRS